MSAISFQHQQPAESFSAILKPEIARVHLVPEAKSPLPKTRDHTSFLLSRFQGSLSNSNKKGLKKLFKKTRISNIRDHSLF